MRNASCQHNAWREASNGLRLPVGHGPIGDLRLLLFGNHILVDLDGLVGNRFPAEVVPCTLVAGLSHLLRLFRIGHDSVDGVGHIMYELVRIGRGTGAVMQLVDRHEIACLAVDDDFRNAAGGGGDDRQPACHGLQVHDAERLVDGWADERRPS